VQADAEGADATAILRWADCSVRASRSLLSPHVDSSGAEWVLAPSHVNAP
jgi:hypothetical protein